MHTASANRRSSREGRIETQQDIDAPGGPRAGRRLGLYTGVVVLVAAWLTPLPQLAAAGFGGRMLAHIAVVALAAPLIAGTLAGMPALMARLPRSLVSPLPIAMIELAVLWLWHVPILHGLARLSPWAWAAEQVSLFIIALLLWTTALRPPRASEGGAGAGIFALLLTAMQMMLLGMLLTFAPWPLYTYAIETLGEVYAQLAGQRVGGMLMLLGGLPHLAGGLYLAGRLLQGLPGVVKPARFASSTDGR